MSKKTIVIVVVILAVLGLGAILLLALLGPAIGNVFENILDDASIIGEDFLQALKESDYDAAYARLHPDVQGEIPGPDALEALFPPTTIATWEYEVDSITTTDGEAGVAMIGILTLSDGSQLDMQIILVRVGEENRVVGFLFEPR